MTTITYKKATTNDNRSWKKITKRARIIRWAYYNKYKTIKKGAQELGQSESRFMGMLNGLQRAGYITFTKTESGKAVNLRLTQSAYYARYYITSGIA